MEIGEWIESVGRRLVESGFYTPAQAADELQNGLALYWSDVADRQARVAPALANVRALQAVGPQGSWLLLRQAFDDLMAGGIVARAHLGTDQSEASGLINDEIDREQIAGRAVQGFAFFHRQQTFRGAAEGRLYVNFDCFDHAPVGLPTDSVEQTLANFKARAARLRPAKAVIGQTITKTLRGHGLVVEWDGDPDQVIHIETERAIAIKFPNSPRGIKS